MCLKQLFSNILKVANVQRCYSSSRTNVFPKYSVPDYRQLQLKAIKVDSMIITCHQRCLHTSKPRYALPPELWQFLRRALKGVAIKMGMNLKNRWRSLPKDKKGYVMNQIQNNKQKILIYSGIVGGFIYIYYISHVVVDPITGRKKFLLFSDQQLINMAKIKCKNIKKDYGKQLVTSGHTHRHVAKITRRILKANYDLPGTKRKWRVHIIKDSKTLNAFVLPNGDIFVSTGMIDAVSNDDQLAAVLSHEIAHVLLKHGSETASKTHLLELLILLPIIVIWAVLPDQMAGIANSVLLYFSGIFFHLPFSRSLETEADTVGLMMMAKACYDPREASAFWRKMENIDEKEPNEWFSTHPNHETRYEHLDEMLPEMQKLFTKHCRMSDIGSRK